VFARLTASQIRNSLGCAAALCSAAVALSPATALADATAPAGCEAEKFSQPFAAFNDFNYYKLVPGGEFNNSAAEGWLLSGGAQVVTATRPDGTSRGVLDLPSGSEAISPLITVTLQDRTARVWARDLKGGGVKVSVSYLGTDSWVHPKDVGHIHGQGSSWTLATPFNVQPQTAGPEEGVRKVRFVIDADGKNNETQLFALWVDPRMIGDSQYAGGCGAGSGSSGALIRGATGESPQGVG
jgi:hypothetical protein